MALMLPAVALLLALLHATVLSASIHAHDSLAGILGLQGVIVAVETFGVAAST